MAKRKTAKAKEITEQRIREIGAEVGLADGNVLQEIERYRDGRALSGAYRADHRGEAEWRERLGWVADALGGASKLRAASAVRARQAAEADRY